MVRCDIPALVVSVWQTRYRKYKYIWRHGGLNAKQSIVRDCETCNGRDHVMQLKRSNYLLCLRRSGASLV